jgi:hypothetical protein
MIRDVNAAGPSKRAESSSLDPAGLTHYYAIVPRRSWLAIFAGSQLALATLGASCGQRAVTLLPGIVNDPGNRSLRKAIFGFAVDKLCTEMKTRSLPLKMSEADPSIGRFFPTACSVTQLGNDHLFVQFVGHGYGWTNITGRMGFEAAASVEYDHDFLVDDGSMYVYFRQVQHQSSSFKPVMYERTDGGVAGGALSLLGSNVPAVVQQVGQRVLQSQLARGFTVVRDEDGEVAFSAGVLEKGKKPLVPFAKGDSDWPLLANDRTELHTGQRDFAGPFDVPNAKHALHLTVALEGAAKIDVLVVQKSTGDTWIAQYERYAQTGAPPLPAAFEDSVQAPLDNLSAPVAYRGIAPWRKRLPLAPGSYYIVFDHTATAGKTAPAAAAFDDRAALVSYAVQLGDAQ